MMDEMGEFFAGGLLDSDVPGRTDQLPRTVPADSYVIPADIVGALGQGNSTAGAALLDQIMGAYGGMKSGGAAERQRSVPVVVAGGEYIVRPEQVAGIGGGDLKAGHKVLDQMVTKIRRQTAERLRKLPKPAK